MNRPVTVRPSMAAAIGCMLALGSVVECGCGDSNVDAPSDTGVARPALPQVVGEAQFDQEVLQSKVPVLVDFYASWCQPCRQLTPTLQAVAAETNAVKIIQIDVDRNHALANRYEVQAIPNLLLFENGEVRAHLDTPIGKKQLESMVGL